MKSRNRLSHAKRLYIGIDIGGTNIQTALAEESGLMICRAKTDSPRGAGPAAVVEALEKTIADALQRGGRKIDDITAMGIAVPGVVDPARGYVAITPNMPLSGVALGAELEEKFRVPITLGNDANLGALGETWLGAGRKSKSVMYLCVGTGIGGGLVLQGKLRRGWRESAGEIGHTIMQIDGPQCSCGNRGCLEALASRTAIERELRAAIGAGRKSLISELSGGELGVIRSGVIRTALEAQDELTREVIFRAAEVLGYACLNVRHLIDPETIVLGGGVIEACGDYILPIIEQVVAQDPLVGARPAGKILLSALGDDAIVLGAVAAARRLVGRNPLKKRYRIRPIYPTITGCIDGEITVAGKTYHRDVYISVNGRVKKREETPGQEAADFARGLGPKELEIICRGGPAVLFIGSGELGHVELSDAARRFLEQRAIKCKILSTAKAVEAYNKSKRRKAAIINIT